MLTKGLACAVWCFPGPCLYSWSTSYVKGPPLLVLRSKMMYVMLCLVAWSCPTLCDPMDRSPSGSSVHGDSPCKKTRVACHVLLRRIFPTQGSNPGLPHCGWILYLLRHQEMPGVGSLSLLQGVFPTQDLNLGLLHCRQIL